MKNLATSVIFIVSILMIQNAKADQEREVLTPDETILGSELIDFPNDSNIFADKSDFHLLHTIIMSNAKGERWATITISNKASGRRSFHQDQLLALLADGSRRFPLSFSREFKSGETASVLVNFGPSQFPILKIMTRN